jgi:GR25 family glycosyltransferase involved in LPS biosynthesis
MKLFFINLDRRPDRKRFMELQKLTWIVAERYTAIDGKRLFEFGISNKELLLFQKADFMKSKYKKNIIGNFLSHLRLMKKIIDEEIPISIITQDDMEFGENFETEVKNVMNNLPIDAEIINIGFHKRAVYAKVIPWDLKGQKRETNGHYKSNVNEYVGRGKESTNPCSSTYIVTLEGAKNFVKYIEDMGVFRATDHEMNHYLIKKNIYYFSTLVLSTGGDHGSDVFGE